MRSKEIQMWSELHPKNKQHYWPMISAVVGTCYYCIVENFGGRKLWRIWRIIVEFAKV